jgi:hypothetical protein
MSFRRLLVASAVAALGSAPLSARAWGRLGHQIIGYLAEEQLTKEAKAAVHRLLHGQHLSEEGSWADDIVQSRPETAKWHYVNIPNEGGNYRAPRDCPNGQCVVAKIEEYRRVLADRSMPPGERAEALKFVLHLVADGQQPMHCVDLEDRGGNDVEVTMKGHSGSLTLHQVWDTTLIEDAMLLRSVHTYEKQLARDLTGTFVKNFSNGTVTDWINQCHSDGETIFDDLKLHGGREKVKLPDDYARRRAGTIEVEMERASIRVAKVINEALAKETVTKE